jgi:hypothetical protein
VWKLLSLVIAVAIWGVVASEPELSTFTTVRLEYKNLPGDLEISSEPLNSVALELRGPSGELRGVGEVVRPSVVLDMSSVRPGITTFTIGDSNVKLARSVHLVRAIPSEVRFEFERRMVRTVPVRVRLAGGPPAGYSVTSQKAEPKDVTIVGPASHVARIGAVVTDPVDDSAVVGSSQFHVNVFVDDPYVRFTSTPQVTVTVTMKKM